MRNNIYIYIYIYMYVRMYVCLCMYKINATIAALWQTFIETPVSEPEMFIIHHSQFLAIAYKNVFSVVP